jgi:hypothetical protein
MLAAIKSGDNEMARLGALSAEIDNLEVDEGIQNMTPAFRQGFVKLFLMNGGTIEQLAK